MQDLLAPTVPSTVLQSTLKPKELESTPTTTTSTATTVYETSLQEAPEPKSQYSRRARPEQRSSVVWIIGCFDSLIMN